MINAAAGFRAKTGRAIAVVLCARGSAPEFVWRGEVSLVDPSMPATGEPYHEVMEMPCAAFSESEIKDKASSAAWKEIGRVAGAPWRTDERLAAAAAWSALSRSV